MRKRGRCPECKGVFALTVGDNHLGRGNTATSHGPDELYAHFTAWDEPCPGSGLRPEVVVEIA